MIKIFISLILIISISACSSIRTGDIFKGKKMDQPKQETKKPSDKSQSNILSADTKKSYNAVLKAVMWSKWEVAFSDQDTGEIILKEAYVYRNNGKLLRVYHWPESAYIKSSNISDYIKKVTNSNNYTFNDSIAFTQENMKIKLKNVSADKTRINFEYVIRPYTLSKTISSEMNSSGYIENVILEKAKESL